MNLNLKKLPWYGYVGLLGAITLGAIGAFYQFYVVPTTIELEGRQQKLAALRTDIAKGSITALQLNRFKQQVADLEGRLDGLKAVLPEQKDVADLLRHIQMLAAQSNLTIHGFKPAKTVIKQLHVEWPIALQLEGNYHNLGMFFDRVSKFSRIINITNIDIRSKDRPDTASTISADCVATTFVLLDAKASAPVGAPASAPASVPAKSN